MTIKKQDSEFRHPDTVAYLQSLTKEEAAKQPPLVRESGGIITQYWREGGRVRCREVDADELSGPGASETEALLAAAEAEFGRLLPKLKAELAGGGVPDPAPSRHRFAQDCSAAGRRPMRPCSRRSTPSFRPRAAGHAEGGRNGTAGSRRRSIRASGCSASGGRTTSAARAATATFPWTARWVWKARAPRPARKASMPTPRVPTAARRRSASSGISPA